MISLNEEMPWENFQKLCFTYFKCMCQKKSSKNIFVYFFTMLLYTLLKISVWISIQFQCLQFPIKSIFLRFKSVAIDKPPPFNCIPPTFLLWLVNYFHIHWLLSIKWHQLRRKRWIIKKKKRLVIMSHDDYITSAQNQKMSF